MSQTLSCALNPQENSILVYILVPVVVVGGLALAGLCCVMGLRNKSKKVGGTRPLVIHTCMSYIHACTHTCMHTRTQGCASLGLSPPCVRLNAGPRFSKKRCMPTYRDVYRTMPVCMSLYATTWTHVYGARCTARGRASRTQDLELRINNIILYIYIVVGDRRRSTHPYSPPTLEL